MELWTPGHNFITDSLIMWGLISILDTDCKGKVIGTGGRYRIILEGDCKLEERLIDMLKDKVTTETKGKRTRYVLQDDRFSASVDFNTRDGSAESVAKVVEELKEGSIKLKDVFSFNHIENFDEGRLGRAKNLKSLYVPFSGVYGKFLTTDFKYEDRPYKVCYYCITLSYLGFTNSVSVVKRKTERLYFILGFEGEASIDGLRSLLNPIWYKEGEKSLSRALSFRSKKEAALSPLSLSLIYLTKVDVTRRQILSSASWLMGIIGYDVGSLKRVTKFHLVELASIIDLIDKLTYIYPSFGRLVDELLDPVAIENDSDLVLNQISELSFNRSLDTVYSAIRNFRVLLKRLESIPQKDKKKAQATKLHKSLSSLISTKFGEALISLL